MYPHLNLSIASGLPGRLLFLQLQLIKLACCTLDIPKPFDWVWHAGVFKNLNPIKYLERPTFSHLLSHFSVIVFLWL